MELVDEGQLTFEDLEWELEFWEEDRDLAPIRELEKLNLFSAHGEGELRAMYNKAIGYYYQNDFYEAEDWCHTIFERKGITELDTLVLYKYFGLFGNKAYP